MEENEIRHKLKAYLEGKLSEREGLEIQLWLTDHSEDDWVKEQLNVYFNELPLKDSEGTEEALRVVSKRLSLNHQKQNDSVPTRRFNFRTALLAAAIAVPLALIAGYFLHDSSDVEWVEMNVPVGKTESLALSDGTMLELNSGTRITYPSEFKGKERRVFIEGEVLADVAKDKRKPFIIQSAEVSVQVHGTKFDFKSYRNTECVEILLLEGSVSMNINAEDNVREVKMAPGDIVQYNRESGDVSLSDFRPDTFRPFTDNRAIHFFNLSLRDITQDLERLFGTRIIIQNESLAEEKYFAYFTNNESLDEILSALNANGKMMIRHGEDIIYLSAAKR